MKCCARMPQTRHPNVIGRQFSWFAGIARLCQHLGGPACEQRRRRGSLHPKSRWREKIRPSLRQAASSHSDRVWRRPDERHRHGPLLGIRTVDSRRQAEVPDMWGTDVLASSACAAASMRQPWHRLTQRWPRVLPRAKREPTRLKSRTIDHHTALRVPEPRSSPGRGQQSVYSRGGVRL